MASKKSGDDYQIGYGKPPESGRFQPGVSGNPKGRSKGALGLFTLMDKEMKSRVVVRENGRDRKISKREAIAKQLTNKAATGDPKALNAVLIVERQLEQRENAPQRASVLGSPEDQAVMQHFLERLDSLRQAPAADTAEKLAGDSGNGQAPEAGDG